jgi:hypothetical protein
MGTVAVWAAVSWVLVAASLAAGYALGRGKSRAREDELEAIVARLAGARSEDERARPEARWLRAASAERGETLPRSA